MTSEREIPASSLAKRITARMVKEKLIDPTRAERFSRSLASGKLKEGDWRLEIETTSKAKTTSRKGE